MFDKLLLKEILQQKSVPKGSVLSVCTCHYSLRLCIKCKL